MAATAELLAWEIGNGAGGAGDGGTGRRENGVTNFASAFKGQVGGGRAGPTCSMDIIFENHLIWCCDRIGSGCVWGWGVLDFGGCVRVFGTSVATDYLGLRVFEEFQILVAFRHLVLMDIGDVYTFLGGEKASSFFFGKKGS
jgi:hypothetical protein